MIIFLLNALKIIVMLGCLVFIHEGGHFIVAKLFKIKVNEFAIGFGPTIFSKEKGETKYAIRLIPLGGFISVEGEEERSDIEGSFSKASILKRILIVMAGAVVNITFGLIIYFVLVSSNGTFYSTTVDYTLDEYVTQNYNIIPGDKILKVNDIKVKSKNDITKILEKTNGEELNITLIRNNEKMDIEILPSVINNNEKNTYYLGIVFEKIEDTFLNRIYYGLINTKDFSLSILDNLKQLFTGKVSTNQMVGIVGISDIVVSTDGLYEYVYIIALISLSLGITNLMPLLPLDGGKIVIYIIEWIRKKPMKEETVLKIQTWGFTLLIALSIYVTYNDIVRII